MLVHSVLEQLDSMVCTVQDKVYILEGKVYILEGMVCINQRKVCICKSKMHKYRLIGDNYIGSIEEGIYSKEGTSTHSKKELDGVYKDSLNSIDQCTFLDHT